MKKTILMLAVLLVPVMTFAVDPGGKISRRKVSSLVSQYRNKQGVEVFDLGYLGTSLLKGVMALADGNDKDTRDALMALKGLKGLTVFSYEEASEELKRTINGKLERILQGVDLLMEAKDEGDMMRLYGTYNEKTGKVSDVGIFVPTDGAFIYLVGSFNLDDISKVMSND
ncbi:MAG: DUF4252 domain-containing protein [Bacteroidales bacterium]|nr:DUF4252 domain-containing protein [Bacteroidales bacterium]